MDRALHYRNWLVNRSANHSAMRYGANGTFMTGKLGVVGMYVDSLGKPGDCNEQHSEKRNGSHEPASNSGRPNHNVSTHYTF
jgi:hypothetical protein